MTFSWRNSPFENRWQWGLCNMGTLFLEKMLLSNFLKCHFSIVWAPPGRFRSPPLYWGGGINLKYPVQIKPKLSAVLDTNWGVHVHWSVPIGVRGACCHARLWFCCRSWRMCWRQLPVLSTETESVSIFFSSSSHTPTAFCSAPTPILFYRCEWDSVTIPCSQQMAYKDKFSGRLALQRFNLDVASTSANKYHPYLPFVALSVFVSTLFSLYLLNLQVSTWKW